jgi:anti-sigma factor RsiW
VRHIPEEELNAYLDQALSRSQCIEIETHLALCSACRRSRDGIAALRDRTTSLLALTAPRRKAAPAWSELQSRAVASQRRPWKRSALWAASVAGALLAGWGLRTAADPHGVLADNAVQAPELPAIVATIPPALEQTDIHVSTVPVDPTPAYGSDTEVRLATTRRPVVAPAPAIASGTLALDPSWNVISLADAEEQTGRLVPILPDDPVRSLKRSVDVFCRSAGDAVASVVGILTTTCDGNAPDRAAKALRRMDRR